MSETAPPQQAALPSRRSGAQSGRIILAALLYFTIVFGVGILLGPPRVLWLEPWLGQTLAVLCEAPLLVLAMWFGARAAPRWAEMSGGWMSYLASGILALVFQQMADLAVGFGLRGMTLTSQLDYFASPPGMIYLTLLAVFMLMPLARRLSQKGGAIP